MLFLGGRSGVIHLPVTLLIASTGHSVDDLPGDYLRTLATNVGSRHPDCRWRSVMYVQSACMDALCSLMVTHPCDDCQDTHVADRAKDVPSLVSTALHRTGHNKERIQVSEIYTLSLLLAQQLPRDTTPGRKCPGPSNGHYPGCECTASKTVSSPLSLLLTLVCIYHAVKRGS